MARSMRALETAAGHSAMPRFSSSAALRCSRSLSRHSHVAATRRRAYPAERAVGLRFIFVFTGDQKKIEGRCADRIFR